MSLDLSFFLKSTKWEARVCPWLVQPLCLAGTLQRFLNNDFIIGHIYVNMMEME